MRLRLSCVDMAHLPRSVDGPDCRRVARSAKGAATRRAGAPDARIAIPDARPEHAARCRHDEDARAGRRDARAGRATAPRRQSALRRDATRTPARRRDIDTAFDRLHDQPYRRHTMNAPSRPSRPQDPPADGLGQRRLRRHRHHAADRRRVAGRSLRPALRRNGPRRGRRQRQRDARRRAPRLQGDVDRLRLHAARARRRTRAGRALRRDVRSGRRRSAALRGRVVRRRAVDVRRDVHARPRARGVGARARLPSRRPHRPRQLDTGRLHRTAVQDARPPAAAARRCAAAVAVGRGSASAHRCSASAPPRSP